MTAETDAKPAMKLTGAENRRRLRSVARPLDALSPAQQKTLEVLGRYRYLTVAQLAAAGVAKSESHIRSDVLPRLCRRASENLVECRKYPLSNAHGGFPSVYALTKYGAEILSEIERSDLSEILYPTGGIQFANDLRHRAAYIDWCIAFDAWIAEDESRQCLALRHYFDKTGSNRSGPARMRPETRIDFDAGAYIVPDGLAFFENGGKRVAVAVELHHHTDPKRVAEQLEKHMAAIRSGAVTRRLGHDKANRVLSISTEASLAVRIMERMLAVPGFRENFLPLFAFNVLDGVKADFGSGWVLADGSPAGFFE